MATRTQKSARKRADGKAGARKPSPAKAPGAGKAAKPRAKPAMTYEEAQAAPAAEPKKPSFAERFWHRMGERAKAREERAAQAKQERALAQEQAQRAEEARLAAAAEAERERRQHEQAEERRRAAKARREMQKAAEEEAARLEEEERQRKAGEARAREEAKERAKEQRRLQRQAERAALEERERRLAEEAEAEDRRREAERRARKEAEAAAALAAAEAGPEPELEFEEQSEPVDPSRALVPKPGAKARRGAAGGDEAAAEDEAGPAGGPRSPADEQAERMAAELARRRSKPVVLDEDLPEAPRLPKGVLAQEPAAPLDTSEPVVRDEFRTTPPPPAPTGLSIPEMFLLVANEGGWDERVEKDRPGRLGGALAGALLLELHLRGRILVQRDRITIVGEPTGDQALAAAVEKLRRIRERKPDIASLRHMALLAKWNRELLQPFKERLAGRGLAEPSHRMHLGLFYRSQVTVTDEDAQERLRNKLRRAIAGGGTPEAPSVLLLGLLDACGLLGSIVPDEAMDYNRKRLNGLLAGRDIMGYKVDPQLKATQEVAVRTILQNVRAMTLRG